MLRHLPKYTYSGLTIVLSSPSRFDKKELIEGAAAGSYFANECLAPEVNRYQCDIRLCDDNSPFYPGTKVLLILGAKAHSKYCSNPTSLDENRGSPYFYNGLPCISSFSPQDAMDIKDWEGQYWSREDDDEDDSDEAKAGEVFESKGRGRTSRENYRFWLKADCKKALRILNNDGKIPSHNLNPEYIIALDPDIIIDYLRKVKNDTLYFDCETDFITLDMRCFAFSFESKPNIIYVVPILDCNYQPYYGTTKQNQIYVALAIAISNNTLVAHNGSLFDYFVLAVKYRLPVSKVYDSMIVAHRIYPTIEKSLGHWVSLCTYEPYHKNEGVHTYRNRDQANQLYLYCGKDVFTMYLVKKWQDDMASKDAGLKASIEAANDAIVPYLTMTLMGMHFKESKRQEWIRESDRLCEHYMKIMRKLTGPDIAPLISNQKCVQYFHTELGYKVQMKTKKGKPSLAADALYKLGLKYENPVIRLLIAYREKLKECGTLNFKVWKE